MQSFEHFLRHSRRRCRIVTDDWIKRLKSSRVPGCHGVCARPRSFRNGANRLLLPSGKHRTGARLARSGTHPINHFTIHRVFLGPCHAHWSHSFSPFFLVFPRMKCENKLAPFCPRSYWFIFAPRCPTTYSRRTHRHTYIQHNRRVREKKGEELAIGSEQEQTHRVGSEHTGVVSVKMVGDYFKKKKKKKYRWGHLHRTISDFNINKKKNLKFMVKVNSAKGSFYHVFPSNRRCRIHLTFLSILYVQNRVPQV